MFERNPQNIINFRSFTDQYFDEASLNTRNRTKLIRVINSAIYVEEPLSIMTPHKKNATTLNYTTGEDAKCRQKPLKSKRCCCYSNEANCPCHPEKETGIDERRTLPAKTGGKPVRQVKSSVKLSLTSIVQPEDERNEAMKSWLAKKEESRRTRQLEEQKLKEEQEKEKQLIIAKERESFKKWLEEKKRNEQKKKLELEMKRNEELMKDTTRETRELENKLSYNLWLQRKKQQELEKKIREKVSYLHDCEDRQKRLEENERAFNDWLKFSKNKPKPIPLNQGLQSLRSSTSVSYINPVPWQHIL